MPQIKRIFSTLSNNKGLCCPFSPIFCQEGYCRECQISFDGRSLTEFALSASSPHRQAFSPYTPLTGVSHNMKPKTGGATFGA